MIDYLTNEEQAQLDALRGRDSFVRDVLVQLNRIVSSRSFGRVQQRAKDFLTFVVTKTLLGQADEIKELTIGVVVFERSDFDPAQSAVVRVAAADLRQRLLDYAAQEGRDDLVHILIPLNTYVPEFRDQRPTLGIAAFENWHPQGKQAYLCATIAEELAYRLEKAGVRVTLGERGFVAPGWCQYTLRGSVESQEDRVRLNLSLADAAGERIVFSRIVEGARDELLKLTREVADALQKELAVVTPDTPPPPVAVRKRTRISGDQSP